MKGIRPLLGDSLSAAQLLRVDTICQRFEAAWKQGTTPSLEEFLSDAGGAERAALLRELLRLELRFRGGRADSTEYESRFPQDTLAVRAVFANASANGSHSSPLPCTQGRGAGVRGWISK